MSLFMQALLVAVFVTVAFIDSHTTQTHIFRPVVVGPVVGLIMGDVQTGFAVGVTVELMFLAVIFVGTAVPVSYTHLKQGSGALGADRQRYIKAKPAGLQKL